MSGNIIRASVTYPVVGYIVPVSMAIDPMNANVQPWSAIRILLVPSLALSLFLFLLMLLQPSTETSNNSELNVWERRAPLVVLHWPY